MEATYEDRFPFRLWMVEDTSVLLCLRTQERWPGPKGQIFCLRDDPGESESGGPESGAVVERERVVSYRRIGRRLVVSLDRPQRKRCDFLFLSREYKNRPGSYEQIFFRTEHAIRQHRNRGRRELYGQPEIEVLIDSAERYPWSFPGAGIRREALPVGDYALVLESKIGAVVERKTFENMVQEVARIRVFHQQLSDLARFPRAALVIEAAYADFSDPKHLAGRYRGGYVARVLAEITALHPRIQIVYAGTRKLAAQWTHGFFTAEAARRAQHGDTTRLGNAAEQRHATEDSLFVAEGTGETGMDTRAHLDPRVFAHEIRSEILSTTGEFRMKELTARHPEVSASRIRRVVAELRDEGRLAASGRASGVRYRVVDAY